jgi:hypothetical protein
VGYQSGTSRLTVASSGSGQFSYVSDLDSGRYEDISRGKRKGISYIIKAL